MPAPRADSRNGQKRRKTLTESNDVLADSKLNTGVMENGLNSTPVIKPRAYQLEMLEASLRENIIIAMDTGSGKTQVAILRIRHELETCAAHKFVWFLTPTVALAEQQHKSISQQLSAYETRLLLGSDNVNYWSTKKIWDDILLNIRIVVSTPQVLLDAMTHGFVTMPQIALLVFDEGMSSFHGCYMYCTSANWTSAIEDNLNARCETPRIHREELMRYVHRPELCTVNFQEDDSLGSDILRSLHEILQAVDMEQDPWIKKLRQQKDQRSQENLLNALEKRKTFCMAQMSKLLRQAVSIHEDLGQWAADAFISEVLKRLETKRARQPTDILDTLEERSELCL
ncbi:dicer-like protein [Histoplasma capsulatum H143]|uniref:Dicer-like protein n=1 Tax=Ajellomyces capsulatus (strain H143) TaxID=544712 RepID=C6HK90_AJECH|nr:dicer-like protein [Histoplasma capsulatum H143]